MKILLTTASDDNIWVLSKKVIPLLLKGIKWKYDYYHFHDGDIELCKPVLGNNIIKMQPPKEPLNNATNNVYRNIVEFIREKGYDRWMHFDGDMFIGGSDPEVFVDYVIKEDKVGTRLQPYGQINLHKDGTPEFALYEAISSQLMYLSGENAIKICDEFIYQKNVPWTFECAVSVNFGFYPCVKYPLFLIPIHCHFPHDRATGEDRLNRLNKFLTNYYAYEDFKYKDNVKYPWAGAFFHQMLAFRRQVVGSYLAISNDIMIKDRADRAEYVIDFFEYAKTQSPDNIVT